MTHVIPLNIKTQNDRCKNPSSQRHALQCRQVQNENPFADGSYESLPFEIGEHFGNLFLCGAGKVCDILSAELQVQALINITHAIC